VKILIVPSTLRRGAQSCLTVAREANASARRVAGLPSPEGMPPEATGRLHAAVAQLARSSASAERQAEFLLARAERGLLADGPLGALLDLTGPGLLSPWNMPAAPKKPKEHHWYDGPLSFADGVYDEASETIVGVGKTGLGLSAHVIDGDIPGVLAPRLPFTGRTSDHLPFLARQRRDLDAAARWAAEHPGEFATAVGKDLVAYDDHAKGDNAHGAGRNALGIAGLLVPFSKSASAVKASRAANAAKDAEAAAARASAESRVSREAAQGRYDDARAHQRADETPLGQAQRVRSARWQLARARGEARLADERLQTELQRSREAAERAAEGKAEAMRKSGDGTASTLGQSGAKVLDQHEPSR